MSCEKIGDLSSSCRFEHERENENLKRQSLEAIEYTCNICDSGLAVAGYMHPCLQQHIRCSQ